MASSLGSIPEDFPIHGVYECPLVAELPSLIYGMRATFRELIWDAEGGFADDWRDRSSVEGTPEDGYTFRISRRAFSAANMGIFAAGAGSGGGGVSGGATVVLALAPGLNSNVEIPDVATVSVVAATGDTDTVLDSILRPPPAGGGDPEATDYHSVIFVNDQATNSLILRPGKGTPFADLVTPDGEDYVLGPREGAVLVYLHYVSAWTVHPLAKPDTGDAVSLHGTAVPALSDGVLTSASGVLSWAAAAGTGDVIGPAGAVADRVAVYNGATGKLIKDGGKTIAAVEASAAATATAAAATYTDTHGLWFTGLDTDFTVLPAQTIITGANVIGGKTWTGVDIGTYSNLFAIQLGVGLQMKANALNSGMYNTFRTMSHIKIRLSDICPGIHLKSRVRITAVQETTGETAGSEVTQVALGSWTHHATDVSMVRLVNGFITGANQNRVDGWRTSTYVDNDDTAQPAANRQGQIQLDSIPEWQGHFLSSPYTLATPVVWNDPKTFVKSRGFDFLAKYRAVLGVSGNGFLQTNYADAPVNRDVTELAVLVSVSTGNTANNTSLLGSLRALRIEYTK
ncbi:MAG: hypothetical protein RLZZ450_59 [Pseudomonadota bacterium]|jgi:hypothetical protein